MSKYKCINKMKKSITFLFATMMIFSVTSVNAQTIELNKEAKEEFEKKINQLVDVFLTNLSIIGSKDINITDSVKISYISSTLKMFLGGEKGVKGYYQKQGDREHEYYNDRNDEERIAPFMQVTNLRGYTSNIPIRRYLNNLKGLGYNKVIIKQAETCYVSDLFVVGDHYEAIATYFQYFRGERGDGFVYQDYTKKTIQIIVYVEEVLGKNMYVVRFGNILANETRPVN